MSRTARIRFDHLGLVTSEKKDGERWVEAIRVWVTRPRAHPFHIEWLRFEPDSPVTGPLRTQPHLAFRVDDAHAATKGHQVLLAPFDVGNGFATVALVEHQGGVIKFMRGALDRSSRQTCTPTRRLTPFRPQPLPARLRSGFTM